MNKISTLWLTCLAVVLLAACGSSASGAIQPGDKVGEFTITQGGAEAVEKIFGWGQAGVCKKAPDEAAWVCTIGTGETANVSVGIYADPVSGKSLDEIWEEHTFEMFINDRPVDLAAFGAIDVTHPQVGQMRWYDVAIQADQAGEIVVRGEGVVSGQAISDKTTYIASEP
jgi:hypothetical protein